MSHIPFVNCCRVDSLKQLFEYTKFIQDYALKQSQAGQGVIIPVWFRGHHHVDYELVPSLMRKNRTNPVQPYYAYSTMQMQEDERYHGFRAKVNHLFSNHPETRIEWEELMQHHLVSTRLMDWTESIQTALSFALDVMLNPGDDEALKKKRQDIEPVIWALLPQRLNGKVYDRLSDSKYIEKAIALHETLHFMRVRVADMISKAMQSNRDAFFGPPAKSIEQPALENMICLSVINQQRAACESHIYEQLKRLEFNPFYYLLSRYYSDGLPAQSPLPPLAALHPYHSERIRAQQGAFTVFPINCHKKIGQWAGANPDAMEYYPGMDQCLFEIRITNASRVAHELLMSGVRRSSLYPEPQNYAMELEAKRYFY